MNLQDLEPQTLSSYSLCAGEHADTIWMNSSSNDGGSNDVGIIERTSTAEPELKTPPLYRVLLMNDDFTPMDFVIHVLQRFFNKPTDEATRIMLEVHHKGAGTCGVFSHEIAETKVHIVNTYARQNRFPLKCTMEKAEI